MRAALRFFFVLAVLAVFGLLFAFTMVWVAVMAAVLIVVALVASLFIRPRIRVTVTRGAPGPAGPAPRLRIIDGKVTMKTTDREEVEQAFPGIARESFPDDAGVEWPIRGVREHGGYLCVESEPQPPTVGYPRFRFVIGRTAAGALDAFGCYCLDGGRWTLLFTAPGTPTDWQGLKFDQ